MPPKANTAIPQARDNIRRPSQPSTTAGGNPAICRGQQQGINGAWGGAGRGNEMQPYRLRKPQAVNHNVPIGVAELNGATPSLLAGGVARCGNRAVPPPPPRHLVRRRLSRWQLYRHLRPDLERQIGKGLGHPLQLGP